MSPTGRILTCNETSGIGNWTIDGPSISIVNFLSSFVVEFESNIDPISFHLRHRPCEFRPIPCSHRRRHLPLFECNWSSFTTHSSPGEHSPNPKVHAFGSFFVSSSSSAVPCVSFWHLLFKIDDPVGQWHNGTSFDNRTQISSFGQSLGTVSSHGRPKFAVISVENVISVNFLTVK